MKKLHTDLTRLENAKNAVGPQLKSIIPKMDTMSLTELKTGFLNIVNNPITVIGKYKKIEYIQNTSKVKTKISMMKYITSVYLSSANMSVI